MPLPLKRHHFWIAGGLVVLLVVAFWLTRRQPNYIPADHVRAEAHAWGSAYDLDPNFIFAIAMAESSLNANANSGFARGLMQISNAAWQDVSTTDYRQAYEWRLNMEIGTRYLDHLRDRLVEDEQFDYARLAAAYRYGYRALAQKQFSVADLPAPRNQIYRQLFRGAIPAFDG